MTTRRARVPQKGPIEVSALYGALNSKRDAREMSWRELAKELDLSASVFTRLAQGRRPDLESYILMTGWLGVSTDSFVAGPKPTEAKAEKTVEMISGYLRADRALKPESAKAIEKIVRAAYDQMAER
jgi:transcriptional regulator with XRE-family HTH domain